MASAVVCAEAPGLDPRRESSSLLFYRAVRDLKPVWMLEDIRTMEACYQEEDTLRTYSPSEALLYAIVHDHQAYALYLLTHYPEQALDSPGERFCCGSPSPHLSMAVRYDRQSILGLIVQESRRALRPDPEDLVHLACELQRSEALLLLLGTGADPLSLDRDGRTPLDVLLEKLRDSGPGGIHRERRQCLDTLLLFMSRLRFRMRATLERDPELWTGLLGEDTFRYLSGRSPAPLLMAAMRAVLGGLRPQEFPQNLQQLPVPAALLLGNI
uniref:Zgc:112001 n=1 Tax=Gouania willdenowi TaxID=441366 RepID=A0A8C5DQM5_GOUWI